MFVLIALILCALAYVVVKRRYSYWKSRNIPFIPPSFPFGNLKEHCIGNQYVGETIKEIYDATPKEKYVGIFHYFTPVLIVKDQDEIRNILTKNFDYFASRDEWLDRDLECFSMSLFHMQDKEEWKALRSKLVKTFTTLKLKGMLGDILRYSDKMMLKISSKVEEAKRKGFKDGAPIEIKGIVSDFATELLFSCFFGLDVDVKDDLLIDVRDSIAVPRLTTFIRITLYNIARFLPLLLKVRLMPKHVNQFFIGLAEDAGNRSSDAVKKNKSTNIFYELHNEMEQKTDSEQKYKLSTDMIAAQCFLFFAAAFDTSSFAVGATLRCLAEYPEAQAKLHEEIDKMLEKTNGEITYDGVLDLPYLDKAIAEALRLMTPIPEVVRKCSKEFTTLGGDIIEEGTKILIPTYSIHRDPLYYPEPEKFDPERFGPESTLMHERYDYLPFGAGPRSCLGKRFGIYLVKVGLVRILKQYRVDSDPNFPEFPVQVDPKIFVVTVTKDGFRFKISERKEAPQYN